MFKYITTNVTNMSGAITAQNDIKTSCAFPLNILISGYLRNSYTVNQYILATFYKYDFRMSKVFWINVYSVGRELF